MIYMNLVCDGETCRHSVGIGFDALSETWGDIVDHVKARGWSTTGGPEQGSMKTFCQACSPAASDGEMRRVADSVG